MASISDHYIPVIIILFPYLKEDAEFRPLSPPKPRYVNTFRLFLNGLSHAISGTLTFIS
jgi:hypothetical protein